jgi:hypothetical protein
MFPHSAATNSTARFMPSANQGFVQRPGLSPAQPSSPTQAQAQAQVQAQAAPPAPPPTVQTADTSKVSGMWNADTHLYSLLFYFLFHKCSIRLIAFMLNKLRYAILVEEHSPLWSLWFLWFYISVVPNKYLMLLGNVVLTFLVVFCRWIEACYCYTDQTIWWDIQSPWWFTSYPSKKAWNRRQFKENRGIIRQTK